MRGCVKAVLLVLLLGSFELAAQCWTPRHSFHFRTTALDLHVDGDFLWMATSYGVQLLDGTEVVDSIALPGATKVVVADGSGFAYAGSGSRIHVLRRDGRTLTRVRTVDAPGTVNDLELVTGYLFAATSSGIAHYQLFDRTTPTRTSVTMATSSTNVTSLAAGPVLLFAADGDATVEAFAITSPASPLSIGVVNAMPLATSVNLEGDLLYVSDRFGRTTDVFRGLDRIARVPFGANSLAISMTGVHFVAGPDRSVRAVSFASSNPAIEYFEIQLAPTGGTDNTIHDLVRIGETLYIAGGDMGLSTLNMHAIAAPFPQIAYATGATSSVRVSGNKAYFADLAGIIAERRIDPNGIALVEERTWNAGAGAVVRDVRENALLSSAGAHLALWSLLSATPASAFNVQLADTIAEAVIGDAYSVALLANGAVYTVANGSTVTKVNVPKMAHLARAGSAIAMLELQDEPGRTVLHYWPTGDLATAARKIALDGVAIGNLALDATRAALFNFRGINVIDLASGVSYAIPNTDAFFPRQLAFGGDDLLSLDSRALHVYDDARTLVREQPLAADAVAMDVSGNIAVLATLDGVAAVSRAVTLPHAAAGYGNSYYTEVALDDDRAYLFSRSGIDVFSTSTSSPLRMIGTIRAQGAIDIAADGGRLFTISGNGTISTWSPFGALLAQTMLNEGADATPISIHAVNGRAWVSLSTGCTSGACVYKTVVTNASGTAIEATLTGELLDVATNGTRAFALFENPNEIRIYDVAGAPAQIVSIAAPAGASSIAHGANQVHVLAELVRSYNDTNLNFLGQHASTVAPDELHRVRVAGNCGILTGRRESPELFTLPAWSPQAPYEVPSNVRAVAVENGVALLLTGHSLEVWSTRPEETPGRRRSVR